MLRDTSEKLKEAAARLTALVEGSIVKLLVDLGGERKTRRDPFPGRLDGARKLREEYFEFPTHELACTFFVGAKKAHLNVKKPESGVRVVEWGY